MSGSTPPTPSDVCPKNAWVAEYYAGVLDESRSAELERHLDKCPACAEAADTLTDSSDATIRVLCMFASGEDDEPEFRELESRLLSLGAADVGWRGRTRWAAPPVGTLPCAFGNYELQRCIGRGAWGAVYRARHTKLDLPVAVKVLDPARLPDAQAVEHFLREARAAGRLRHPSIVRATDAGQQNGLHYLAMDLIEGLDAGQLLKRDGRLRVPDACEIVRQAALALEHAHRQGWVHRDVKPSNLIIDHDGAVKLLDLGIAGQQATLPQGQEGERPLGTAEYMAPEQWSDFHSVDGRADVYSLGCTLWKLITGEPWTPDAAGRLNELCPGASRRLARLLHAMVEPNAEQRIGTAGEVAARLRLPARGAQLRTLVRRLQQSDATQSDPPVAPAATPWLPRRRVLTAVGGAGLAAALTPWVFTSNAPKLRRSGWRALRPADDVWFSLAPDEPAPITPNEDQGLRLEPSDLTLVSLGRAIAAPFSVRLQFRQRDWRGAVGLFFAGSQAPDAPVDRFHLVELRPPDDPAAPDRRRVLWSLWRADPAAGAMRRTPLAEVQVRLQGNRGPQSLAVTVGGGAPAVQWNGRSLPQQQWTFSPEGQRVGSQPASCLGHIGVAANGDQTDFFHPELAYL